MNSIWLNESSSVKYDFNTLSKNLKTKVCIIGGGITGISTAYELTKNNIDFILLEKDNIVSKSTPRTTAKVTSQHGLIYNYLINSYGIEFAKKYLNANEEAIKNIENIVKKENIDCDFVREDSYVFTNNDSNIVDIKAEVDAVNKISDNKAEFVVNEKLPLEYKCGIRFKDQATFNPVKYINGLLGAIQNSNIYENSTVYSISRKKRKV